MKSHRIYVKISETDKQRIADYARMHNTDIAKLFRECFINYIIEQDEPTAKALDTLKSIQRELNHIGNNINQIAKHLNGGQSDSDFSALEEFSKSAKELRKALNQVRPLRSS